jgi:hypothetical protein
MAYIVLEVRNDKVDNVMDALNTLVGERPETDSSTRWGRDDQVRWAARGSNIVRIFSLEEDQIEALRDLDKEKLLEATSIFGP